MKTSNSEFKGYILVVIAGILWGTIGVFVTELTKYGLDAGMISFLRIGFAFFLSLGVTIWKYGAKSLKIGWRELFFCALLGIVCHGVYNIFYSLAVTNAGVSVSSVLLRIAPAVTMITSAFLFKEKITRNKVIAIIVNIIGCALVVTGGHLTIATFSLIGIICGVGAGVCYAMTAILGRFASSNVNPFVVSTYSYLFAMISLFFYAKPAGQLGALPAQVWGIAIAYAIIPTTIGYLFYYAGNERITNSSIVPVLASLETVVATFFGIFLYHEQLGVVNIFGIALVMASIIITQIKTGAHSVEHAI